MFSNKQRLLLLTLNGHAVLSPADYSFRVHGQGWITAADLQRGDQVRTHEDQDAILDAITDLGEQPRICYMEMDVPPYCQAGILLPGTLVTIAEGRKRIEDLRPGDHILAGEADTPTGR